MEILNAASTGDKVTLERLFLSGVDMNTSDYDYRQGGDLSLVQRHQDTALSLLEIMVITERFCNVWDHSILLTHRSFPCMDLNQSERSISTDLDQ